MAISLTAIAATFALFFRTRFGLAARAVIANRAMASCIGIDTRRLDRWTFAVGAGLAGLAGAAMAPLIAVDPQAGLGWLVPAFLAILVRRPRLDSPDRWSGRPGSAGSTA